MIPLVKVAMPPRELLMSQLESVLYSGMIAEGEYVYEFEAQFSAMFNLRYPVATSSGTAALHLALLLSEVSPGDEIITTSMTAEPTNTAILQASCIPVFADVDKYTGNICPESVIRCITKKTKAIMVVHYAGYPAALDKLRRIADEYSLCLIEDCAHALGAKYNGRHVGSYGDFAIFSFQAIKHITTVDGGMLIVKNLEKVESAKKLRWFGMKKGASRLDMDISVLGYKYNMHNVSAVIGLLQLKNFPELLKNNIRNATTFNEKLSSEKSSSIMPAMVEVGAEPSYWLYTLLASNDGKIIQGLADIGVAASKLHRPNHLHSIFKSFRNDRGLPSLSFFYEKLVHIPCGWWLSRKNSEAILGKLLEL